MLGLRNVAVGFLGLICLMVSAAGCGDSESDMASTQMSTETLPAARESIQSLPFAIGTKVRKIDGTTVLVGSAKPKSGRLFRFYLTVGHNAPKPLIRQIGHTLEGGAITPNYVFLTPIEAPGGEGSNRWEIEHALQQSLCRQATGRSCSI
jgi:hypothetical protein